MIRSVALMILLTCLSGCNMLTAWQTIPPPGGCDRCHQQQISARWQLVLTSAEVPQAADRYAWQRPQDDLPSGSRGPEPPFVEEACFGCHRSPDQAHAAYRGRYHQRP